MKLYVGNLAYRPTEDELSKGFEAYGAVASVNIVIHCDSGRSRGFAFVEMPDDVDGNEALSKVNGKDPSGRPLRVDKANPPKPRQQRRFP